MNLISRASQSVRRLDLRLDTLVERPADYPVVTVLVDGQDVLSQSRPGFTGFGPDVILGERSPLLPIHPWRRVAVYCCSCGEPGCGVIAPLITRRSDGTVVWTDFRDYVGVFVEPTVDEDPDGGTPLDQGDIVFDHDQYVAEVRRLSSDRSWESPRRLTSRLLEEALGAADDVFARAGFTLGWVSPTWPDEDSWTVMLESVGAPRHRRRVLELQLTAPPAEPSERARVMATRLLAVRPENWPSEFGVP